MLRIRGRKEGREQRRADRAVGGLAQSDDAARAQQVPVARRERARDGRQAPDKRHEENALDPAPPVGEERQRNCAERDGDRDDRDEPAQLAVGERPLRLEMRKHRHHDLAIDVIDDHQREQDREYGPRVDRRATGSAGRGASGRKAMVTSHWIGPWRGARISGALRLDA